MGSKSKIDQARLISSMYLVSFEEVYDLLKKGKSAAAVTRKMKRRQKKLHLERAKVREILRLYSNGDLGPYGDAKVREATVANVLRAASAGRMDDVARFVMGKKNKVKHWMLLTSIVVRLVVVGMGAFGIIYSIPNDYAEGNRLDLVLGVMGVIMYTAIFVYYTWYQPRSLDAFKDYAKWRHRCEGKQQWFKNKPNYMLILKDSKVILWKCPITDTPICG